MNDTPSNSNLIVYRKALEAATIVLTIVNRVPAPMRSLADQAIRSATSVPSNLAEGHGRTGRDRFHHWRIAYASAMEIDGQLRMLAGARAIDRARARESMRLFDEVRAMTWRLLHP